MGVTSQLTLVCRLTPTLTRPRRGGEYKESDSDRHGNLSSLHMTWFDFFPQVMFIPISASQSPVKLVFRFSIKALVPSAKSWVWAMAPKLLASNSSPEARSISWLRLINILDAFSAKRGREA